MEFFNIATVEQDFLVSLLSEKDYKKAFELEAPKYPYKDKIDIDAIKEHEISFAISSEEEDVLTNVMNIFA